MRRINMILWGIIGMGLISCSSYSGKKYERYKGFPEEKTLRSEVIELDTAVFRYPFRVKVYQDMAVVLDLHNMDYYMHAFTYPGWEHIVSFGKRGSGPEELLSAETFQINSRDSIWVLDANKMKITRWGIDKEVRSATCLEEILLDKELIRTLDFTEISSGFIVPDYSGEYRYHYLDREGKIQKSSGHIPTEKKQTGASVTLAQAWRSFIGYSPGCGRLSFVTQLGEVLEVIDPENETSRVLYGPFGEPEYQDYQGEGIPTGIMGFSDMQMTDNYIYTVFHGRTFKEIGQNVRQGIQTEDGGRFIYVFDLEGNPVRKYILDRAIYGISVDEQSGTIIATDVNSNDPIVKFSMW